jgi:hypothetical protein
MADSAELDARLVEAVECISVNSYGQYLVLQELSLTNVAAQYVVDFLQGLSREAVFSLELVDCDMTPQALEIFRAYFATTTLEDVSMTGNLESIEVSRLLSALHGNRNVQSVELLQSQACLDGAATGAVLSGLLQNVPQLKHLQCSHDLGPEVARALQTGLRLANRTLDWLTLHYCDLGDEGVSLLVDGLLEGTTIVKEIGLVGNNITSAGLCHIARLLEHQQQQQPQSSLTMVRIHDALALLYEIPE